MYPAMCSCKSVMHGARHSEDSTDARTSVMRMSLIPKAKHERGAERMGTNHAEWTTRRTRDGTAKSSDATAHLLLNTTRPGICQCGLSGRSSGLTVGEEGVPVSPVSISTLPHPHQHPLLPVVMETEASLIPPLPSVRSHVSGSSVTLSAAFLCFVISVLFYIWHKLHCTFAGTKRAG